MPLTPSTPETLESLTRSPESVMESVQARLRQISGSMKSNSAKFATSIAAVLALSGPAMAQDSSTAGSTVVAAATVPSERRGGTPETVSKTSDGRDFVKLTEKEVDGLPRAEKKKYYTWLEARDTATIIETDQVNEQKKATIIAKKEEGTQMDATIIAKKEELAQLRALVSLRKNELAKMKVQTVEIKNLLTLVSTFQAKGSLTPAEKEEARKGLSNPQIPENLKRDLALIFGIMDIS